MRARAILAAALAAGLAVATPAVARTSPARAGTVVLAAARATTVAIGDPSPDLGRPHCRTYRRGWRCAVRYVDGDGDGFVIRGDVDARGRLVRGSLVFITKAVTTGG